jgi:hypothetical protein
MSLSFKKKGMHETEEENIRKKISKKNTKNEKRKKEKKRKNE